MVTSLGGGEVERWRGGWVIGIHIHMSPSKASWSTRSVTRCSAVQFSMYTGNHCTPRNQGSTRTRLDSWDASINGLCSPPHPSPHFPSTARVRVRVHTHRPAPSSLATSSHLSSSQTPSIHFPTDAALIEQPSRLQPSPLPCKACSVFITHL